MHSQTVLVEMDEASSATIMDALAGLGFALDRAFLPIPMEGGTIVVRGKVQTSRLAEIRNVPGVRSVSEESQIEPF